MVRIEETLRRLKELLRRESLDTRDPDILGMIEELSVKARAIRRKLNRSSVVTHACHNQPLMAETKEPTIQERRLDQLAEQFAQTHDEKIRIEILELARKLPISSN